MIAPLGHQRQPEEGGVVVDPAEKSLDEPLETVGGFRVVLPGVGDVLQHLIVHALQTGSQQLIPVGEVDVHGGSGHAGFGGDLVHRDIGGAALAEQTPGHRDDLIPPEVPDDLLEVLGPLVRCHLRRDAGGGGEGDR